MKKTLLLSVIASGFIYAGGNIAPVQPVAPTAAPAACDFWGQIGFRYEALTKNGKDLLKSVGNKSKATVVLGVEKDLGYGFGFGAEVAGTMKFDGKLNKTGEDAELSQLYVTYKAGNTALKVGRQALPKSVSPWAWSDRSLGRIDTAFNGITIVNTDISDTTLVGAWIPQTAKGATNGKINGSNKGLFMLGAIYKGISNSTLSTSLYYVPKNGAKGKAVSAWATAETKVSNVGLGLQLAYAKADANSFAVKDSTKPVKGSFAVMSYAKTKFQGLGAKLTLGYINKGNTALNLGGTTALWTSDDYDGLGDVVPGVNQTIARADFDYKIYGGKLYFGAGINKPSTGSTAVGARIGYKFKVAGVNAKVEYKYVKNRKFKTGDAGKYQRIRIEAKYKF